ncbi:MAG: hypothetical protein BWY07_02763 [Candidatus Hydrogenedentes bacterium ADurb.Bin170]|nr:MAG: hypothetical protein BWY07_02763 [Candidatus Hydrogenedentes bacterium ADurb.Bin170]
MAGAALFLLLHITQPYGAVLPAIVLLYHVSHKADDNDDLIGDALQRAELMLKKWHAHDRQQRFGSCKGKRPGAR